MACCLEVGGENVLETQLSYVFPLESLQAITNTLWKGISFGSIKEKIILSENSFF